LAVALHGEVGDGDGESGVGGQLGDEPLQGASAQWGGGAAVLADEVGVLGAVGEVVAGGRSGEVGVGDGPMSVSDSRVRYTVEAFSRGWVGASVVCSCSGVAWPNSLRLSMREIRADVARRPWRRRLAAATCGSRVGLVVPTDIASSPSTRRPAVMGRATLSIIVPTVCY